MKEKQRNTEFQARANIETVETVVTDRRMRCLGHRARIDARSIPRKLLFCRLDVGKRAVEGERCRGQTLLPRT